MKGIANNGISDAMEYPEGDQLMLYLKSFFLKVIGSDLLMK
jgi:hypothetical protein